MLVKILGTAAGGAYPQWNCNCSVCAHSRSVTFSEEQKGSPRKNRFHAALAVSASMKQWYVVNATPDIAQQIESFPSLHPGPGVRETPLKGILLTDAELDHTIGLLNLREGARHDVFATDTVIGALTLQFPVVKVLQPYSQIGWSTVTAGKPFFLDDERIRVEPFAVGNKAPRYIAANLDLETGETCEVRAEQSQASMGDAMSPSRVSTLEKTQIEDAWVTAYKFCDSRGGGKLVVAPQIAKVTDRLLDWFYDADCLLLDGTCAYEDDLERAGVKGKRASEMGHLPIFGSGIEEGVEESIASGIARLNERRLADDKSRIRTILIHINNTNPLLVDEALRQQLFADSAIEVADDGMEFEV